MKSVLAYALATMVALAAAAEVAYTQSAGSGSGGGTGQSSTDNSRGDRPGPMGGGTLSTPGGAAGSSGTQGTPGTMSSPSGSAPSGSGTGAAAGTPPSGDTSSTPAGRAVAEDTEAIRHAQQQLQAAGFSPGPINGILDDRTREALREFQRSKGLQETGQLDQETRSALLSSSGTPRPSEKSQ